MLSPGLTLSGCKLATHGTVQRKQHLPKMRSITASKRHPSTDDARKSRAPDAALRCIGIVVMHGIAIGIIVTVSLTHG